MNPVLDIAVRVAGALLLVALNAAVAARVLAGALGGRGAGGGAASGPGRHRPLADVVKLLAKEDTTHRAADRRLARAVPGLLLVASFLSIAPLALSPVARLGSFGAGLVLASAALAIGPSALLLAGTSSGDAADRHATVRAAVGRLAGVGPLVLSMLTPVMLAGGADVLSIVEAQRGTWLFGFLPRWFALSPNVVAFALFAASAHIVAGTPVHGSDGTSPSGEALTALSGPRYAIAVLAEYTALFAVCALAAIVFAGGWLLPYLDRAPFADAIGPVVLLAKTYALMLLFVRMRRRIPRSGPGLAMRLSWTRLVPLTLAWAVAFAFAMRAVGT